MNRICKECFHFCGFNDGLGLCMRTVEGLGITLHENDTCGRWITEKQWRRKERDVGRRGRPPKNL